jgi:hypothetical protein
MYLPTQHSFLDLDSSYYNRINHPSIEVCGARLGETLAHLLLPVALSRAPLIPIAA